MPSRSDPPSIQDNDHGGVVQMPDSVSRAAESEKRNDTSPSQTSSPRTSEEVEFKEGGYGWVVVACVFLINAHTWGLNSSYAVFLAYYLNSGAFPGASPITLAFVGGLSFSVVQSAALVGASFTTQIWHLLLSQGIGFGVGMGFTFNATVGVIPQWFIVRRSFASAIGSAGSGLGGLIYSLSSTAMIHNIGLPWAFRILAILSFVVNGICCVLMRDRNKALGSVHAAFHKDLFKRTEFWLFMSWGFFSLFAYVIVVFSLADFAETVGFTASQGSIASAMFQLSQGIGRPIIGLISDRVGRINVAGLGTLVAGLATLFVWIFSGRYFAGTIIYALFGAFAGCIWATVTPVGAEVVGIQLLPSALSIFWMILVLPATFAEPIALTIKGSDIDAYLGVEIFVGFMYIAAFISLWSLRVWKIRELESLDLPEHERADALRNNDALSLSTSRRTGPKPSLVHSIFKGALAVQRV
ncbi:hypothetical protein CBS470a_010930 [Colletotrichum nupharicola]|nr:hypothetical protein CBS470a_010930 [Colletotrichum nupharicola]